VPPKAAKLLGMVKGRGLMCLGSGSNEAKHKLKKASQGSLGGALEVIHDPNC